MNHRTLRKGGAVLCGAAVLLFATPGTRAEDPLVDYLSSQGYCQVKVIGARPAHRQLTSDLIKHTSPRSKQRRHEPAAGPTRKRFWVIPCTDKNRQSHNVSS